MHRAKALLEAAKEFLTRVYHESHDLGLNLDPFEWDHICLRVENWDQYKEQKEAFSQVGLLLSEALVGGRPIATYKLREPLSFLRHRIPCVEIPAPKAGSSYAFGWEHVECVVEEDLEAFAARHTELIFDKRALKKSLNPELVWKLPSGLSVKFHRQSLEEVIKIENSHSAQ